jgi:hypothetical protein
MSGTSKGLSFRAFYDEDDENIEKGWNQLRYRCLYVHYHVIAKEIENCRSRYPPAIRAARMPSPEEEFRKIFANKAITTTR